jgi:hypothetical protein
MKTAQGKGGSRPYATNHGGGDEAALERLERLADLFDAKFRVPGTRWRVGLDSIIGLVPGIGDVFTAGISAYIFWNARHMGASRTAQAKMAALFLTDLAVGAVPIAGDIFDAAWKANKRSVNVLKKDLKKR